MIVVDYARYVKESSDKNDEENIEKPPSNWNISIYSQKVCFRNKFHM